MEDELVIRQKMEDTRTSLTDKLETLEGKVAETVEGTTEAVTETVATVKESITETVEAVKDSVEETVTAVKDTVEEGIETVKSVFDVPHWVEQYPWPVMAGSVAVGFCLERYLTSEAEVLLPQAQSAPAAHANEAAGDRGNLVERRSSGASTSSCKTASSDFAVAASRTSPSST